MPSSRPNPIALPPSEEATGTRRTRRRAPRHTGGHRAQLTVPEEVWSEVMGIADAAGTTPNDVLVRLAAERLEEHRRSTELSRRAEERWQGFLNAAPSPATTAAPLDERELIELGGTLRSEA